MNFREPLGRWPKGKAMITPSTPSQHPQYCKGSGVGGGA